MFLGTSGIVDVNFNQKSANTTQSRACARVCVCVFCGVTETSASMNRLFTVVRYHFNINQCGLYYMNMSFS